MPHNLLKPQVGTTQLWSDVEQVATTVSVAGGSPNIHAGASLLGTVPAMLLLLPTPNCSSTGAPILLPASEEAVSELSNWKLHPCCCCTTAGTVRGGGGREAEAEVVWMQLLAAQPDPRWKLHPYHSQGKATKQEEKQQRQGCNWKLSGPVTAS